MYMTVLLYLRICCKESFYLFDVLIANCLFHIMISFLSANQVSINIFFVVRNGSASVACNFVPMER